MRRGQAKKMRLLILIVIVIVLVAVEAPSQHPCDCPSLVR